MSLGMLSDYRRAFQARRPLELEYRLRRHEGGGGIDVTERQRAEEKLRESEARFRELANNIDEVFWLADAELKSIVYVSPAYERVWGRSCESLRKEPRSFLNAIHPQDRPRMLEAIKARTDVPYELEYRIIRPDGSVRWISDRSFSDPKPSRRHLPLWRHRV
jgi:PAS domain S-box-containing protein